MCSARTHVQKVGNSDYKGITGSKSVGDAIEGIRRSHGVSEEVGKRIEKTFAEKIKSVKPWIPYG